MEETSYNVLNLYSEDLKIWRKALYGTDFQRFYFREPPQPNNEAITAMIEEDSTLFRDIVDDMCDKGVEKTLRRLKTGCLVNYYFFKSKPNEKNEKYEYLSKLLRAGDIFLQICSDKAMAMGGDPKAIETITGVCPRGAGGIDHRCTNSLGKCTRNNEPQQEKTLQDLLPDNLKTDKAIKIFQKAIDAKMMEKTATGLLWCYSNALLAYLCGIVYCGDTKQWDGYNKVYQVKRGSAFFPETGLNRLFGVKNLGQSRLQLTTLPRKHEEVDDLFN